MKLPLRLKENSQNTEMTHLGAKTAVKLESGRPIGHIRVKGYSTPCLYVTDYLDIPLNSKD